MVCFHALFELSLGKLSRDREFRADRIAAETTSARDFAGAMLRIVGYSKFRHSVERDLFKQEQAMENADVADRIERGFPAFAVAFAADPEIRQSQTAHPFDSHPPMLQRLGALGIELTVEDSQAVLATPGDGGWYHSIPDADAIERQQWRVYEDRFRKYHEESLPFRFLPETAEEQAVVEKSFRPVVFEGKDGTLAIDFEKIKHATWSDALLFSEIVRCELGDYSVLNIYYKRVLENSRPINIKKFSKDHQRVVLAVFQRYYGRYLAAVEYQKQSKNDTDDSPRPNENSG
jgi:hypothetical protein